MAIGENGDEILQAGWKTHQCLEMIGLFLLQAGEIMDGSIGVGGRDQQHFDLSLNFRLEGPPLPRKLRPVRAEAGGTRCFRAAGHALLDDLVYQRDYIVFPNRSTFEDSRIKAAEAPARRRWIAGFNLRS